MGKTALIFPGLGYHPDKPLLYYGKKLAGELGYKVIEIRYGGFAWGVKDNPVKMREAFESALSQTEEILGDRTGELESVFQEPGFQDDLLFISKSIGTAVAAAWQKKHRLTGRHLYYTPVAETFLFARPGSGIAFHGTADSWVDTRTVEEECTRLKLPLYITEGADHSMETGDPVKDLEILIDIIKKSREYL